MKNNSPIAGESTLKFWKRPATLVVSVLGAAALAACGGGGDSSSGLDDATASAYASNAAYINSDAADATDASVAATQEVVQGSATAASAARATAQSAGAQPAAATLPSTYNCVNGGTANVAITGGVDGSELNGKFDAGEVYTVTFNGCQTSHSAGPISGALVLTVGAGTTGDVSAGNGTLQVSSTTTGLVTTLPRGGTVTLTGTTSRTVTATTASDGSVDLAGHFATTGLTMATQLNNRSGTFTLTADVERDAVLVNGVVQSSSIDGTHTLTAAVQRGNFTYTVATNGAATYDANGTPVTGSWTITLPDNLIGVTIANGTATITIDKGKDGTIDRTITVPMPALTTDAG